jgi:hypothetical protein
VYIRFYADLGENVTETLAMITQAFGEESMSRTWCLNGVLGSGQTKNSETGEEQSQEHA